MPAPSALAPSALAHGLSTARGEIAGVGPLYFYVTACDAAIARAFQQYEKPLP